GLEAPAAAGASDEGRFTRLARMPLGEGAVLLALIAIADPSGARADWARTDDAHDDAPSATSDAELDRVLQAAAQEILLALTRHGEKAPPSLAKTGRLTKPHAALVARITELLRALTAASGGIAGLVARRREIIAETGAIDEARRARVEFAARRLDLSAAQDGR